MSAQRITTRSGWPAALTIAGSDSGGGAGIQADLKSFAALGAYGTSAITAITAQNTLGVRDAHHLPPEVVVEQIMAVVDDITPVAAKTGMLANAGIVRAVAETLASLPDLPVVVDPVMFAATGYPLLEADAMTAMREELIPIATVVTPNLHEARELTGIEITTTDDMIAAGESLLKAGARAVLVKGGHRQDHADDLFIDENTREWLHAERVETKNTHGTGCSLSAAIAAGIARGIPLLDAIRNAKAYVHEGLKAGYDVGEGHSPIDHFHAHHASVERIYA